MFLDWVRQGQFLVGKGEAGSEPFRALVSKAPRGYEVGVFFKKGYIDSELHDTLEGAKSWSESLIDQFSSELGSVGDWSQVPELVAPTSEVPEVVGSTSEVSGVVIPSSEVPVVLGSKV